MVAKVTIEAKFPPEIVAVIDALVQQGIYRTRSDAIVALVHAHLDYLSNFGEED